MGFDPVSMAVFSLASTVVGGAVSAMGAMQQAQAAQQAANYRAQVARNNAVMAQQNAVYERQAGAEDAYQQDLKNKAIMGQATAELGASGFDVNSGTPLNIQSDQRRLARVDTLRTRENREFRARQFDQSRLNEDASAGLYTMQASQAKQAGMWNVASSLLGTATSFGNKWTSYKAAGVI